jgi:hypothetical protein
MKYSFGYGKKQQEIKNLNRSKGLAQVWIVSSF